jgi:diguanylate cyclase (GGDEF)-like protein
MPTTPEAFSSAILTAGIVTCAALFVWLCATALRHLDSISKSERPPLPRDDLDLFLRLVDALEEALPGAGPAGGSHEARRPLALDLLERLGRSPADLEALRARLDRAAAWPTQAGAPRAAVERLRALLAASMPAAALTNPALHTTASPASDTSSEGRLLFVSFEQEIRTAERRRAPLTLIDLRLEGLETFEDRFGRAATDRILRGVARAIRSQLRPDDTCVRDAGGAFLVLVPGLAAEAVQALAKRIEAAVARHKFALERGRSVAVEATLCAATFPQDGRSYDALLTAVRTRRALEARGQAAGARSADAFRAYPHRIDTPVN